VPYAGVSGIQAAVAVMHRGLRPEIPGHTPAELAVLIRTCWQAIPDQRPNFAEIAERLERMYFSFCRQLPIAGQELTSLSDLV